METNGQQVHKYINVAYELFFQNAQGVEELFEKAPEEYPFHVISGLGATLPKFEANILALNEGDAFDFTLSQDDAYGPYVPEHVIEMPKETFCINGRFDKDMVYPGATLPLVNGDGIRFEGLVTEVKDNSVVIDLNDPLAGKDIRFKGKVLVLRDATDEELQGFINLMSGEGGCSCGCDDCGDGDGHCGCGHDHHHDEHDGHCGGHGDHHHGHEGHCGCGHCH